MKKYKIFLASSKDLKADRDQFEILIRRKIDQLIDLQIYLELFVWEDSDEAMSPTRSQDEYNKKVAAADIFVLLFQSRVGKYTREEFEKAVDNFLLTQSPAIYTYYNQSNKATPEDSSLTSFFSRLQELGHFYSVYDDSENLLLKFGDQLDKFIKRRHPELFADVPDKNLDKIYFCDRQPQSRLFDSGLKDNKAVQFFLINCHDRDMADFFVRRKKLEFDDEQNKSSTIDLFIRPTIVPDDDFSKLEIAMQLAIKESWNRNVLLKNYKLKKTEPITVDKAVAVLEALEMDYLFIAWEIRSFYWKNDKLKDFISKFYEKYDALNSELNTPKRIFFIGIISFTEGMGMTREEFDNRIKDINYGQIPIRLTKIKVQEIVDWMEDYGIEDNPDQQRTILNNTLPPATDADGYFLSELEYSLRNILEKST